NGAKFVNAIGQERDALRFLMEARETVQQNLSKQPRSVRQEARAFDRIQRQKLRKPNEKAETLPQIAEELAKLADDEDEIARGLAARGNNPTAVEGAGTGNPAAPKNPPKPGKGSEDPAQERQDDIAARASVIDKVAATAKGLTGLAKTRITEGAKAANA